jgi:hypothetical protein
MQTRKNGPATPATPSEVDANELRAWLKSLGVTREQLEKAFRASASRGYPGPRASGRPTGR